MSKQITIVMYHYVRPIAKSEYPGIKGLELEGFRRQLDYLENNYSIISSEELIEAVVKKKKLPANACWLTFDDGYKEHFKYVLPELLKRKLYGAFFPPKVAITEAKMLDVNSIHHILSCHKSMEELMFDLNFLCQNHGISNNKIQSLYKEYGISNRFDDADTIFIKRMLQHVLPEKVRNSITSNLFKKYVGISESDFAKKLYMNIDEVTELVKQGITTIDQLRENKELLNDKQIIGLKYYEELLERIPREEIVRHEGLLKKFLKKTDPNADLTIAGSYRRKKDDSGDIDILLKAESKDTFRQNFTLTHDLPFTPDNFRNFKIN